MGIVNEPVQDRIGDSGCGYDVEPVLDWHLADDYGGAPVASGLEDLKDVAGGVGIHRIHAPVINDQEVSLFESCEQCWVGAVGPGKGGCCKETTASEVACGVSHPAGTVCDSTGDIGFAYSRRAGDDDVRVACDETALGERKHGGFVDVAMGVKVNVLDCGLLPEFSHLKPAGQTPRFL